MSSYAQISDNTELLAALKTDNELQTATFMPQMRWDEYSRRILGELEIHGLHNFRSNHELLKGYADAGFLKPTRPPNRVKRAIWNAIEKYPPASLVVKEYDRILQVSCRSTIEFQISFSLLLLDKIKQDFPNLRIPEGLANGGAVTAFEWEGHTVTTDWVQMLCRAADFYRLYDAETVTSIFEIGSAIGLSTLAHIALNENLRTVVNVDLPYVTYVCGQYLKSFPEIDLVDYLQMRDAAEIDVNQVSPDRVRVLQLPGWQTDKLRGDVDLFLNAASFQEMPRQVCENYVKYAKQITSRYVMLHCGDPRIDDADDQLDSQVTGRHISAAQLVNLFSSAFPKVSVLDEGWCKVYPAGTYRAVILT